MQPDRSCANNTGLVSQHPESFFAHNTGRCEVIRKVLFQFLIVALVAIVEAVQKYVAIIREGREDASPS
jgi:hypothetical protein